MLQGNLSTRPFYNERLVSVAIGVVAVGAVLLSGYDAKRLVDLSSRRSAARAKVEANSREAARIRGQAEVQQRAVDRPTLTRLAAWTREANTLIDQRTFSWTGLFGQLETTLPLDVRLVSISPRVDKGTTHLSLTVVLRDLDDVDVFRENLMQTGAFYDVSPTDQREQEDGTFSARIDASYLSTRSTPGVAASSSRERTVSLWARVYEERRPVIVPVAILAAVSVATLMLAVWPLQRRVANTETQAVEAVLGLAKARALERQAREAADSKRRADRELQAFYTDVLPRDMATATRATNRWLQQAARDAGLEFKASHFDWDVVKDSRLSRAFSTVTLVGRYTNVRRFLYAVETATEFIVVERVGVVQSTSPGTSGNLEVSLIVATYFLSSAGQ